MDNKLSSPAAWLLASTLIIGVSSYATNIVAAHLVTAESYSKFAAGSQVLAAAGVAGGAVVPWLLARRLAQGAKKETFGTYATQGAVFGALCALLLGFCGVVIDDLMFGALVAASAFVTLSSSTYIGWLSGTRRFRTLAGIRVIEATIRVGVSLGLLAATGSAGLGLMGFAAGGFVMASCVMMFGGLGRSGLNWSALERDSMQGLKGMAVSQLLVAFFGTADVVLLSALAGPGAAGYIASVTLAKAATFVAGALGAPLFVMLCTNGINRRYVIRQALLSYAALSICGLGLLIALPIELWHTIFPASYELDVTVRAVAGVVGVGAGALNLVSTVFQAESRYREVVTRSSVGLVLGVSAAAAVFGLTSSVTASMGAFGAVLICAVLILFVAARSSGVSRLKENTAFC
ncbi:hypothetical protein RCG67_01130 [Kocuria sp. CPCC 205292]|uniref:lipopolysaccharide biosynthesis protein n=1 Tax=Kocuria cellulosilytica TaxID=3071451 RepID=UPI0034D5660F